MNVRIQNIRQGIEYCLSNGKRLFDDAGLFYKNGRFSSCIVQDIFAYEEFNKAKGMFAFLAKNEPFYSSDLERLTDGHSHTQKLIGHSLAFDNMIKDDSPEKYNARKNFSLQTGLPFPIFSREETIAMHDDTRRYFAKLHDFRKKLMYAGYDEEKNEWFCSENFDNDILRAVSSYLYYEVIIPYHETRLNLFFFDNRISADMEDQTIQQRKMINEHPDAIALGQTIALCRTDVFIRNWYIAKAVLDSL